MDIVPTKEVASHFYLDKGYSTKTGRFYKNTGWLLGRTRDS